MGAVLSNTLLIVGMGFFLGGIYRIEQRFDPMTTGSSFNELILSVAALILPTAIRFFSNMDSRTIAKFSRAEAVLLFLSYICYICYSCKTHSIYFNAPHPRSARRTQGCKSHTGDAEKGLADVGAALALSSGGQTLQHMNWRRNERIPLPRMSSMALAVILTINTVILGFCTTFAVDSIDGLTQKTVLTQDFVGLILLPLLSCNVHAITLAIEDEMPQSFAISISSSVQLLLCILPLAVIVAWIRSDPTMNLLFDNFQVISLAISVMILRYITDDGRSNWYAFKFCLTFNLQLNEDQARRCRPHGLLRNNCFDIVVLNQPNPWPQLRKLCRQC